MNLNIKPIVVCASLISLTIASSLVAQTEKIGAQNPSMHKDYFGPAFKSTDLIGLDLENQNEEKLGRVEDLAIDLQEGRIIHVIIGKGGFLNIGEHNIALPPSVVRVGPAHKFLLLDVPKAQLKSAPTFEMSHWTEFYQSGQGRDSSQYFGDTLSTHKATVQASESGDGSSSGSVSRATKIIGLQVKNRQNEKVGTVENLMIDLPNRRIVAVIISSGGFLGIGDTLSAVPPMLLSRTNDELQLDITKETLKNRPNFKPGNWPDFNQPAYTENVYQAYNINPASLEASGDTQVGADNTSRNIRDRSLETVVLMDESSDPHDLEITQQIRKAVVETKELSVAAENVKVITVDGRVTLRGPVRTSDEKRLIGEIAARIAKNGNVENQLEINQETSQR